MNKTYAVRVVLPDGIHELSDDTRQLLRLLDQAGAIQIQVFDEDGVCFDVLPPHTHPDTRSWAATFEQTFVVNGYNAVTAPQCPRDDEPAPRQSDDLWLEGVKAALAHSEEVRRQRELEPDEEDDPFEGREKYA